MAEDPLEEKNCTVADLTREVNTRWSAVEKLDTELSMSWRQVAVNERSRFRLWSNNLGACHPVGDQRSADHRLRAAPDVQRRINQLLEELSEDLDDIREIQSGEREGEEEEETLDITTFSEDDDSTRPCSEISELWLMVGDVITSLLKVSVLVRQSSSRNKFDHTVKAAAKANASSTPMTWDVEHIRHKFPKLEAKQWLIQRLGKTATQRRTFLMYAEEHERRIASGKNENVETNSVTSRPTEPSTRATTLAPAKLNSSLLHRLEDYGGDDAVSTTSATTYNTVGGIDSGTNTLSVVPLSSVCVDSKPAICPYCRGMVHFKREKAWRRHVFGDLMTYSCTFEHCDHGPFGSRTAWASHEKRHHLRSWRCPVCHDDFDTQTRVAKHVPAEHPTIDQTLSSELIYHESPQTEQVTISQCPFCDDRRLWGSVLGPPGAITPENQSQNEQCERNTLVPVDLYHRHLGRHMQQLALFAVPPSTGDADDEGEASDRDAQIESSHGDTIHSFEEIHESADEHDVATDTTDQLAPADSSGFINVFAKGRPQYPDSGTANEPDHLPNSRPGDVGPQPQHLAIDADEAGGDRGTGEQRSITRLEPTINNKGDDDIGSSEAPLDVRTGPTDSIVTSFSDRPLSRPAPDKSSSIPLEPDSIPSTLRPELYDETNCSATNVHELPPSLSASENRFNEDFLAHQITREVARHQRALDEAVLRHQEELKVAKNRLSERDAERARWNRLTDPPAYPSPYTAPTRIQFASRPGSPHSTNKQQNYRHGKITLFENLHPNSAPSVTRRPSDSVRERGREIIQRERTRVANEDLNTIVADGARPDEARWEPVFDEVDERSAVRDYYYVTEGSARQEIRRRRDRDDSRRREERRKDFYR